MTEETSIGAILFALILCLIMTWIAARAGYYQLPSDQKTKALHFKEVLGAFVTYFAISFILLPLIAIIANRLHFETLSKTILLWFQLLGFFIIFLGLMTYIFSIKKKTREEIIWGEKKENTSRSIGLGILTLVISYPTVLFISLLVNYFSFHFFGKSGTEQGMVREMKELTKNPLLFTSMAVAIIFIGPFVEELLFRGFLQTYLRKYLGSLGAIFLSSLLFALAHYVRGAGVGNIELLVSLFVLAWYLGFIYERQRNLFASCALHMTFNATTVLAIALK